MRCCIACLRMLCWLCSSVVCCPLQTLLLESTLSVACGLHWLVLSDADVDARGSIAGYAIRPFDVNGLDAIAARVRAGHLCFAITGAALQLLLKVHHSVPKLNDFLMHVCVAAVRVCFGVLLDTLCGCRLLCSPAFRLPKRSKSSHC